MLVGAAAAAAAFCSAVDCKLFLSDRTDLCKLRSSILRTSGCLGSIHHGPCRPWVPTAA